MRRVFTGIVGLALTGMAFGQAWVSSYDAGLKAAKTGDWQNARKAFMKAKTVRSEDVEKPTMLPGPVTEQRKWRGGAAYSPNFLAAYSEYRLGLESKSDGSGLLRTAAEELEGLIAKRQVSREAVFVLSKIYSKLNMPEKKTALNSKISTPNWKVDNEPMAPEELSALSTGGVSATGNGGIVSIVDAAKMNNSNSYNPATPGTLVPTIATKYALIISNGDNKLPGLQLTHALDDSTVLKDTLANSAGYDPANIEVVTNVTAAKILAAAKALAARMPAEGTLFFFFTGAGANIDGRDWLAGVNTEIATDTSSMVKKSEVLASFTQKGISVFSFYQVPRPVVAGASFGEEEPKTGRISQMQSTMSGDTVFSLFKGGKVVGVFADAVSDVMIELHSNSIPISEFGWAVFYKMRRGGNGESGGGSKQTPTLPVLQYLSSTARF